MGTKNNPGPYNCYAKAEPDEPMFVLLGRDPAAATVVALWCDIRERLGETEPEVIAEARRCERAMSIWGERLGKSPRAALRAFHEVVYKLGSHTPTLSALLTQARSIWGPVKLDAAGVLARLMVDAGKLARYVRGATKDKFTCACTTRLNRDNRLGVADPQCPDCNGTGRVRAQDLKLIMGNILFSTIRWCDDLGLDPAECCALAAEQQRRFATENPER